MTVIVLTNCPVALRGFLTRWLLEISPGVFIGGPSTRIRQALWAEVRTYSGQGRALLAYSDNSEQGYSFATHYHKWHPVDHDTDPPPEAKAARVGCARQGLEQGGEAKAVRREMRDG